MTPTLLALLDWDHSQWLAPWSEQWIAETVCSMLVGVACGVLGCFVVLRRMALIGDALAHAVLPGVVLAFMIGGIAWAQWGLNDSGEVTNAAAAWAGPKIAAVIDQISPPILLLIGATITGLLTAVLINLVVRFSRTKEDSSIGIVFTSMFALGIVMISALPQSTHFDLKCFLFGDPLAILPEDLKMMAIICPSVLVIVGLLYYRLKLVSFDPLVAAAMGVSVAAMHYLIMGMLSVTVVAGLKTTGVVLVVAMVITPASAAYQLTNRFWAMLVLAGVFGAVSAALGMSLAFVANSPTGPAMVLVAVGLFALSVIFSPGHGVVFDRIRRYKLARHVENEDVLKAIYRLGPQPSGRFHDTLVLQTQLTTKRVASALRRLRGEELVVDQGDQFTLTPAGVRHAETMVRAHRLWETYLADRMGVSPEEVHDEAERLEHAHDLAERLDETLGRPDVDPHGSAIPRRNEDDEDEPRSPLFPHEG
ncbi:metal ABC transporter permease [Algisphaera agarilytica]|uniref:ABC-type Mn2+/Zn2+ transport system permease subunit/Mn-dependent DtxR family transcriptional regulator n=1 Tax=Algisphaera agarilytica TaxID=1385975 RepID=A0A7X0H5L0_9BACT|nr:metal ABC transporter permease [Algisphaera agarilytica]MBB6428541.1 ABC-type Mn2+/Zn2+ transport system permease subunit/Mn-dependent DtxR family transcriptional regulator [Algisphaera agarilytica]